MRFMPPHMAVPAAVRRLAMSVRCERRRDRRHECDYSRRGAAAYFHRCANAIRAKKPQQKVRSLSAIVHVVPHADTFIGALAFTFFAATHGLKLFALTKYVAGSVTVAFATLNSLSTTFYTLCRREIYGSDFSLYAWRTASDTQQKSLDVHRCRRILQPR